MPLYEYECDACHERFEKIQKFSDPPIEVCARCGKGPVRKLLSSPAIQFKGSGWYITDYAKSGSGKDSRGKESKETKESKEPAKESKDTSSSSDSSASKTDSKAKSE